MKKIILLTLVLAYSHLLKSQTFPYLNASTGNENEFIVDVDSNILMFHGNRIEKLDKNYNFIWTKSYSGILFKNLLLSKTGSLFFISTNNTIGKIEANGSLSWCKSIPTSTVLLSGVTHTMTPSNTNQVYLDRNNNLIFTGTTNPGTFFLKLDTMGNIIKYKFIRYQVGGIDYVAENAHVISDSAGIYNVGLWGPYFEIYFNLIYQYSDQVDSIIKENTFSISGGSGTGTGLYIQEYPRIVKSKSHSNVSYFCVNTKNNGLPSTWPYKLSLIKCIGSVPKWAFEFQNPSYPDLCHFQSIEEDDQNNIYLTIKNDKVSNGLNDFWQFKIDSMGYSNGHKLNLIQNFGKITFSSAQDSITNFKFHYPNRYFQTIETNGLIPGPLSIAIMDSSIAVNCSPTATIAVSTFSVTNNIGAPASKSYNVVLNSLQAITTTTVSSTINTIISTSCIPLDVKEYSKTNSLLIYPSPVDRILNIRIDNNYIIYEILVIDVNGRKIEANCINNQIKTEQLINGIYFIKVITDKGEFRQKFIKE